jgi:hypothetical protein
VGIAVWLGLALGLAAWLIALRRVIALAWRAPVDIAPLARELKRRLSAGDDAGALALCELLPGTWAATLAARVLRAARGPEAEFALEEANLEFEHAADRGLDALRTLARMALPLALGSAIVVLGVGVQSFSVPNAQAALQDALGCVVAGFATLAVCRLSLGSLERQAAERLEEVRRVSAILVECYGLGKYSA